MHHPPQPLTEGKDISALKISGLPGPTQAFFPVSSSKHLGKKKSNFIENVDPKNSVISAIPKLKSKNQQLNKNAVN